MRRSRIRRVDGGDAVVAGARVRIVLGFMICCSVDHVRDVSGTRRALCRQQMIGERQAVARDAAVASVALARKVGNTCACRRTSPDVVLELIDVFSNAIVLTPDRACAALPHADPHVEDSSTRANRARRLAADRVHPENATRDERRADGDSQRVPFASAASRRRASTP